MNLIERTRVAFRDWLIAPSAQECAAARRVRESVLEVVKQEFSAAPRKVRPPFSREFIDCTCDARHPDDCACIRAYLDRRDGVGDRQAGASAP